MARCEKRRCVILVDIIQNQIAECAVRILRISRHLQRKAIFLDGVIKKASQTICVRGYSLVNLDVLDLVFLQQNSSRLSFANDRFCDDSTAFREVNDHRFVSLKSDVVDTATPAPFSNWPGTHIFA